jgi:hypothetical protein
MYGVTLRGELLPDTGVPEYGMGRLVPRYFEKDKGCIWDGNNKTFICLIFFLSRAGEFGAFYAVSCK